LLIIIREELGEFGNFDTEVRIIKEFNLSQRIFNPFKNTEDLNNYALECKVKVIDGVY
jgi:hypothetical protein